MEMGNQNIGVILHEIINLYGDELLGDVTRLNALLMDYAPNLTRERKLIISVLNEGISKDLISCRSLPAQEQTQCITRCVRYLTTESWVAPEAAEYAVSIIAGAIGFDQSGLGLKAQNEQQIVVEVIKGKFETDLDNLDHSLADYQTIGYKAFAANTGLRKLKLPKSIKVIKSKAFVDCTNLKEIELPYEIDEIGYGVFSGCDSLDVISIPSNRRYSVINGLLLDKKSKTLLRATNQIRTKCIIPSEIEIIQTRAFERSAVEEIVLPKHLTKIENNAFVQCNKLCAFEIDKANQSFCTIDGVLHSKDRTKLISFPSGYKGINYIIEDRVAHILDGAFSWSRQLEAVTFTSTVKTIGAKAFEHCLSLSSLVLPSSIELIGERAFQYCEKLSSVMLPRGIREIGDYAFCGCSKITNISIPKSVLRIGNCAFRDCVDLKKIVVQSDIEFIGDGAFAGCDPELEISINNNSYVKNYCLAHKINWSSF